MHATLASDVTWHWATDYDFLARQKIDEIVPWVLLTGDNYGMTYVSTAKAVAKGLTYRPLAVTTADTLAWWNSPAVSSQRREKARFVSTASKEVELLAAMKR